MTENASSLIAFQLPALSVIRVAGKDAIKVLNGLCTAKLAALKPGDCIEAMFTDDRGRILVHAMVALEPNDSGTVWLWGWFSQAEKLAAHIDRFIFREDAAPRVLSTEFVPWLIDGDVGPVDRFKTEFSSAAAGDFAPLNLADPLSASAWLGRWPVTSPQALTCLLPVATAERFNDLLKQNNVAIGSQSTWQSRRIAHFWPLEPTEISERTLPQELDRDRLAISFTKGCYLGQETVARLDALGEVQKKLCLVELHGWTAEAGTQLSQSGKEVGALTSIAPELIAGRQLALAMMRRGWMKPDSQFEVGMSGSAQTVRAHGVVIAHP